MKGFVFTTKYGLVEFEAVTMRQNIPNGIFLTCNENKSYRGFITVPDNYMGDFMTGGEKMWIGHWFTEDQIFETREEAIKSL